LEKEIDGLDEEIVSLQRSLKYKEKLNYKLNEQVEKLEKKLKLNDNIYDYNNNNNNSNNSNAIAELKKNLEDEKNLGKKLLAEVNLLTDEIEVEDTSKRLLETTVKILQEDNTQYFSDIVLLKKRNQSIIAHIFSFKR